MADPSPLQLIPQESADDLVARAKDRWNPIATYCMFSGGNDSSVLAHRCRDQYQALFYIDTGLALPTVQVGDHTIQGVEDFVRSYAEWIGKPLVIRRSGDAYRTRVLGDDHWWERYRATGEGLTLEEFRDRDKFLYGQKEGTVRRGLCKGLELGYYPWGFPGTGHSEVFERLKGRRIEELLREAKEGHARDATVLFLSGIRRAESAARKGYEPLTEKGSAKYVNPITHWTDAEMRDYRVRHELPESDTAAILHRSGECNCAARGSWWEDRELIKSIWPRWFAETIEALEQEALTRGIRYCVWGGFDLVGNRAGGESASHPACDNCAQQLELADAA